MSQRQLAPAQTTQQFGEALGQDNGLVGRCAVGDVDPTMVRMLDDDTGPLSVLNYDPEFSQADRLFSNENSRA